MNRRRFITTNTFVISTALLHSQLKAAGFDQIFTNTTDPLFAGFEKGTSHSPFTLWQWINGCVTKEGITYDLEAFKKAGINDVQQFLIGGTQADVTDPEITVLGDKWMGLMRFALDECRRLGMTFGTHNCPGWSASGAPGILPEESMQKLVWTKTILRGEDSLNKAIPHFEPDARWNYYRDIAVVAVPSGKEVYAKADLLLFTDNINQQQTLKSRLPDGEWLVLRFGHTTTGHENDTAPISGKGLEVDKLSKTALEKFWSLYPAKLIEMAGDHAGTTFKRIESDSYEASEQTWTPNMPNEFKQRCGYDLLPWLPVLAGLTIEDKDLGTRFKQDWQQTLNTMFAENYYGHLNKLIHQKPGMEYLIQPYGTGATNFNFSDVRGIGDLPMCEFWWGPTTWGWDSILPVASNAHVNGKKIVAAESFTGQPQFAWKVDLFDLKAAGDRAFCKGVNLFVFHASAHQPYPNVKPGMTMGWWGTQFGPAQTWWDHGAPQWIQYISRCQLILQKGLYVADICFLHLSKQKDPVFPVGYKADICNPKEFLTRFDVKGKRWLLPDGMAYKVLVLPDNCSISLDLAKKIEQLVKLGGIILGNGFKGSAGIAGLQANEAVKHISDGLFGAPANGVLIKQVNIVGQGKVYVGYTLNEALQGEYIDEDVALPGDDKDILWIHRTDIGEHYYFICNQANAAKQVTINFRVTAKLPELWNPETGAKFDAPVWEMLDDKTSVTLNFEAYGSVFVIFKTSTSAKQGVVTIKLNNSEVNFFNCFFIKKGKPYIRLKQAGGYEIVYGNNHTPKKVQAKPIVSKLLNDNWDLSFQEKRGTPAKAHFNKLISYIEHPESGIRFFSGKAVYSKSFTLMADDISTVKGIFIDLGTVKNVATIIINGNLIRTFWKPPFAVDITEWCKPGKNDLIVEVTNLWPNRMIGDELEPDDCKWGKDRYFTYVTPNLKIGRNLQLIPDWVKQKKERPSKNRITFSTMAFFDKNDPLLPSGLIGPVQISIEDIYPLSRV